MSSQNRPSAVKCPQCGRENHVGNAFCIYCGGPLTAGDFQPDKSLEEGGPREEAGSFGAELRDVRQELRDAGLLLDRIQDRVSRLELLRPDAAPATAPLTLAISRSSHSRGAGGTVSQRYRRRGKARRHIARWTSCCRR